MFRKFLASVGIGGAKVETVLDSNQVRVDQLAGGTVTLTGGSVEQRVNAIFVDACIRVEREHDGKTWQETRTLARVEIRGPFVLEPGQTQSFQFEIDLPAATPVSPDGRARAFLRTELDIAGGMDASDFDPIVVLPAPVQSDVIGAMEDIGFRLAKTDVEHRPNWQTATGFVQEFEFKPVSGMLNRDFDEIEIVFVEGTEGFGLLIQVDRAARGWTGLMMEKMGLDESWHRMELGGGWEGPGRAAIRKALADLLNGL